MHKRLLVNVVALVFAGLTTRYAGCPGAEPDRSGSALEEHVAAPYLCSAEGT